MCCRGASFSWLSQSTLLLDDADARFYRRFHPQPRSPVRYLRHTANDARRGVARMQAANALSYAALCIAGQSRHIKSSTGRLKSEIERQILPDAVTLAAIPERSIEVLLEFLPLRQVFKSRKHRAAAGAAQRHRPHDAVLRFFRHSEGTFAHFNGMGATPVERLMTLLAYDETRGAPLSNALIRPTSGWKPAAAC